MKQLFTSFCLVLLGFVSVNAQVTVSGTVLNVSGESLIGATIIEKGNTSNGVATDIDGQFEISVADLNAVLEISYTGFSTLEVALDGRTTINVTLEEARELLDEIVVIGYGTTSKRFNTDNVTTLTSEDISDVPIANFQSTLSGKAAGVRVTQNNGKVGAGINIRVRGAASISAGNQPLYVLDGVPLINQNESSNGAPTNPLLSLNPNEIESIDILKDASSAAIYGARGANGVVLITTKRGSAGKAQVSLDMTYGTSEPTNLVEWLNAEQYIELILEAKENEVGNSPWLEGWMEGNLDAFSNNTDWRNGEVDTDWSDIAFQTGSEKTVNISVSGGDQKTTYFFGGGFNDTEGILLKNALDRFNGRANVKHNFSEKFNAGLNIGVSKTNLFRVANDNSFLTPLQAIAQAPISPARLENGDPFFGTVYANFLGENDYSNYETVLRRVTGKVFGNYSILPELTLTSDFGYDLSYQTENQFRGSLAPFQSTNGEAFSANATSESYVFSNYLTFIKDFGNDNLNVVVGTEFNQADRFVTTVTGTEFPSDELQTISSAAEITAGTGIETAYNFLSYFARATYIINGKYFVKASIRRDGSSRFGSNRRFGTFPAGSIGWIISEEGSLKSNSTLSFLKLRASYGELGNSEIGNFPSRFLFGGVSYNQRPGIAPTQPGNNNLSWETSKQFDIGLEFGLFDNKITGELDYYTKNTDGLLFSVPLPGNSGASSINRNIGVLESNGVELVINSENVSSQNFNWNTSFNIATNINEIAELPNSDADIIFGRNINRAGEAVSSFFMPEYAGVDPANGDALYYINGEGTGRQTTNDIGEAERIVAGNPFPELTAGITNDFSYKGFNLSFTFMGEWGASIYNSGGRFQSANADWFDNQTVDQLTRWQNPGDITMVPQARFAAGNGTGHSTRWLEKADFIRLRNLTFGYNLPKSVIDAVGFSSARIYVSGINLLTITDYTGYDPESRSDAGGVGQAFYSSPAARTISFGINVNF